MPDVKSLFVWALILVVALMAVSQVVIMNIYNQKAEYYAEKFGPSEITCSLCEGFKSPNCEAMKCHTLPLMNKGEPYGVNFNITN